MAAKRQLDPELLDDLLVALAAGDCLGSTSEFTPMAQVPAMLQTLKGTGWPLKQVGGGAFGWRRGQHTDDTAMAKCMVESFRAQDGFDPVDIAERFVGWMRSSPPDIGGTTRRVLLRIAQGVPWHEAGVAEYEAQPDNAANGSLMRNAVVVGMARSLNDALRMSVLHSIVTHAHPLCVLCCCAQTWMLWRLLNRQWPFRKRHWMVQLFDAWSRFVETTADPHVLAWRKRIGKKAIEKAWLKFGATQFAPGDFDPFHTDFTGRAGYCLLTLQIAVWALCWSIMTEDAYAAPPGLPERIFKRRGPDVLAWVVLIGEDADTYGAVAAPLLYLAHGKLPPGMLRGLEILKVVRQQTKETVKS